MCLTGSETISVHEKRLQNLEADRKQNESICKSLARFSTQFRVKIVLNFCLLGKLKEFGDKSRNSLATEKLQILGVVRPAKLTNHSARTNLGI